jgi:hypothetical protein
LARIGHLPEFESVLIRLIGSICVPSLSAFFWDTDWADGVDFRQISHLHYTQIRANPFDRFNLCSIPVGIFFWDTDWADGVDF